jgi:rubrerythrin
VASLRTEPAGRVDTLDDLFALAYAIEASTAQRYAETAKRLSTRGATHLAEIFERLAEIERSHMQQVRTWAVEHGKNLPIDARALWPIPDTFDASPEELASSKMLTPYRVLAAAVRHEERTFAFWTYVAAHTIDAEVKRAAERMAMEELDRVSLLRQERRHAFHAQRRKSGTIEITVDTAALAGEERRLTSLIQRSATPLSEENELSQELARASQDAAVKLESLSGSYLATLLVPRLAPELRNDPLAVSELLVEAYLTLAGTATDAAVIKVAQDLAGPAIYRLAALRSMSDLKTQPPKRRLATKSAKFSKRGRWSGGGNSG